MPPLPRDPRDRRANSQKLTFENSFVNLTHFSVKDVHFSIKLTKSTKYMLHKSRGVFFQEKQSACGKHIDHGVLGGTLKSTNIDKIHKIHTPKFQGVFLSEVAEAPQAARTQTHRAGRPETGKNVCF